MAFSFHPDLCKVCCLVCEDKCREILSKLKSYRCKAGNIISRMLGPEGLLEPPQMHAINAMRNTRNVDLLEELLQFVASHREVLEMFLLALKEEYCHLYTSILKDFYHALASYPCNSSTPDSAVLQQISWKSMQEKLTDEERRLLICPECRKVMNDPVLLTCLHSYCKTCLELKSSCPRCHRNIEGLKHETNEYVLNRIAAAAKRICSDDGKNGRLTNVSGQVNCSSEQGIPMCRVHGHCVSYWCNKCCDFCCDRYWARKCVPSQHTNRDINVEMNSVKKLIDVFLGNELEADVTNNGFVSLPTQCNKESFRQYFDILRVKKKCQRAATNSEFEKERRRGQHTATNSAFKKARRWGQRIATNSAFNKARRWGQRTAKNSLFKKARRSVVKHYQDFSEEAKDVLEQLSQAYFYASSIRDHDLFVFQQRHVIFQQLHMLLFRTGNTDQFRDLAKVDERYSDHLNGKVKRLLIECLPEKYSSETITEELLGRINVVETADSPAHHFWVENCIEIRQMEIGHHRLRYIAELQLQMADVSNDLAATKERLHQSTETTRYLQQQLDDKEKEIKELRATTASDSTGSIGDSDLKENLRKNMPHFIDHTTRAELKTLLTNLRSKGCLLDGDAQNVNAISGVNEQAEALIDIIMKKGSSCHLIFLRILRNQMNRRDLVDILLSDR